MTRQQPTDTGGETNRATIADYERGDRVRVTVYVRESCPCETTRRQREVISRLCELEDAGSLWMVAVRSWGVRTDISPRCRSAHDTLEQLRDWADDNDCSLGPGYRERTRTERFGDGEDTALSLPAICITVWRGGVLERVYPHVDEHGTRSVADGIDQLTADLQAVHHGSESTSTGETSGERTVHGSR